MAKRKTVAVDDLRSKVNHCLAESTCSPEVRRGMISVLETILHDTGNYRGFTYLESAVPSWEGLHPDYGYKVGFKVEDETRRSYA